MFAVYIIVCDKVLCLRGGDGVGIFDNDGDGTGIGRGISDAGVVVVRCDIGGDCDVVVFSSVLLCAMLYHNIFYASYIIVVQLYQVSTKFHKSVDIIYINS